MKQLFRVFLISCLFSCSEKNPQIKLPALLADNMVLQQNAHATLWGWSEPGIIIGLKTSWGVSSKVRVNTDGKWNMTVNTPNYGGPYTIRIKAKNTIKTIKNVMIGEVWLCSGQSNMEMPLKGWQSGDTILNAKAEIESANYPDIRMFTVERQLSYMPLDSCVGDWKMCSPETASDFSATAYFFGKKLHKDLGVPIGLIHSSWGGTPAESWTSAKYLEYLPVFKGLSKELRGASQKLEEYHTFLSGLKSISLSDLPQTKPFQSLAINDSIYLSENINENEWKVIPIPAAWENTVLPEFNGVVWLRTEFELPDSLYPEGFELYLGDVGDMDVTYVNGHRIGGHERITQRKEKRSYIIPTQALMDGKNVLTVKVINIHGDGGICGTKGPSISKYGKEVVDLSGTWKYCPSAIYYSESFYVLGAEERSSTLNYAVRFPLESSTPSVLFNALIYPLIPYAIQGVVWYQGESNVKNANQYSQLFPTLIDSWRTAWEQGDFPFYFVQIAPYDYEDELNDNVSLIREAQLQSTQVNHTGMVVTMDIGNPKNIHPANKEEVGNRLALWALSQTYGQEDLVFSGPICTQAKFIDDSVELKFKYAANGLELRPDSTSYFEIAGVDSQYVRAVAKLENNTIRLASSVVEKPVYVRYAWGDDVQPNLFNTDGLPASPFRFEK